MHMTAMSSWEPHTLGSRSQLRASSSQMLHPKDRVSGGAQAATASAEKLQLKVFVVNFQQTL